MQHGVPKMAEAPGTQLAEHNLDCEQVPLSHAGASEESDGGRVQPGGVLDERFRWRVLSAKALPHFTGTALMAPQQSSQLQVPVLVVLHFWSPVLYHVDAAPRVAMSMLRMCALHTTSRPSIANRNCVM